MPIVDAAALVQGKMASFQGDRVAVPAASCALQRGVLWSHGFGDKTVNQHPLVCHLMKAARRLLPVSRTLVSPWDLVVVLEGLRGGSFRAAAGDKSETPVS